MSGINIAFPNEDPEAVEARQAEEDVAFAESNMEEASPEEQAQYDEIVTNAMRVMFKEGEDGGELNPKFIDMLKADGDEPVRSVARTTASVITGLERQAQTQSVEFDDGVLYAAGVEILEQVVEAAEPVLKHDFTEREIEYAGLAAIEMYGSEAVQDGRIDQASAAEGLNQLVEANENDTLGDILPGAAEHAKGLKADADAVVNGDQ